MKAIMILALFAMTGYSGILEGIQAGINMSNAESQYQQRYRQGQYQQEMIAIQREQLRQQKLITEAKVREINARTQRLQVRQPIKKKVRLNNNPNLNIFTIRGNGEECSVTYDINNNLYQTTCLQLINSKGIKILCTKHKKICKTEYELISSINQSSNYFTTEKGTQFRVTYNKYGAILKSKSFTIYLGKSCDVTSSNFGTGRWRDGRHMGFSIQFNNKEIIFPKQQIYIKNNAKCI